MTIAPWTNGFPEGAVMTGQTWAAGRRRSSLDQLQQDPAGGPRMDEGDPPAARADPRGRLDHRGSSAAQGGKRRVDVGDAEADVMDPLAAPVEEPGDRRVGRERLEQLETSLARGQERHPDPFGGHLLDPLHLQTEGVPVERQRVVQRSDGDAEMVDDHDGPPSFSISLS